MSLSEGYKFGPWTVEPDRGLVYRDDQRQKIEPKTMEVLVCLLKHAGETVSLQTLLHEVWGNRVVEENSVHRRIYQIRKVLGDSRGNPKYIANVPKRGYRTLAPVTLFTACEQDVEGLVRAAAPVTDTVQLPPSRNILVRINRHLLVGEDLKTYLLFACIGLAPLLFAFVFNFWADRTVDITQFESCSLAEHQMRTIGFGQRWNWLIYPLLLPLWLFLSRRLFRLSYGLSSASPLVTEPKYLPIRNRLIHLLDDWRPFALVLAINLVLTVIDQWDVAARFYNVSAYCPTGHLDWGWYGLVFYDVSQSQALALTLWTTAEQIIFVQMGVGTAVHVFLFNLVYVRSVYLRTHQHRFGALYVLDFDDPDQRFGLRKISRVFELQLFFCVFGGVVLLVERYMNSHMWITTRVAENSICALGWFAERCIFVEPMLETDLSLIFRDTAQIFVAVIWLFYLLTILRIANVKLLPLRLAGERVGRKSYLAEFIPPGSKYDRLLNEDHTGVDRVAKLFRQHHFWPTGDDRARDTLAVCVFIGCLIMLPVLPASPITWSLWVVFAFFGVVAAVLYMWVQRHLLVRVDRSLVR